ncbi:MAG: hypothetical protein GF353_01120, partial [Candidatus Lokiarchaeota archaeon]|nr:hypothetical protein [Candidatus Lokiarchaeota archaeon]
MLELVEILQGISCLVYVVICFILGIKISLKYLRYRQRDLLLVGITWMGLAFPWIPDTINLFLILLFQATLSNAVYFIIVLATLPVPLFCWLIAFTDFRFKKDQKIILLVYLIIAIAFEIAFFILLFQNVRLIGRFLGPFQPEYMLFIQLYLFAIIAVFFITGVLFFIQSMTSESRQVKLRGKLILVAFFLFTTGAIFEVIVPFIPIFVVITR